MFQRLTILITCLSLSLFAQEKKEAEKLFQQGEASLQAGDFQEALIYYNQSLYLNPGFNEAYKSRALVKENLKDISGALTDLNIYLERIPDDREVIFSRGALQFQLKRYEQAKEDFLNVLSLPEGETNTVYYNRSASPDGSHQIVTLQGSIRPLVYNYLGIIETKLNNFKTAMVWLDSALLYENKVADYYVNRGLAKEGAGDSTARSDYEKALTLKPDHSIALNNLANIKRKAGDASASDDLDLAIESDSSMLYPYLERALQRTEGGYFEGALDDYTQALKINDRDPDIWLNRGLVKEKLNDPKGAFSDYTKAIDLKENFEKAWLNRGNVLIKLGRYKDAVEDYTVALTFVPEFGPAYYNRAIAYNKLKDSTHACEDLKKAETLGQKVSDKIRKEFCPKD
ncbi:MAG TPA: tetratricopeptide repeat protein [Ohtaekwangia sp.]